MYADFFVSHLSFYKQEETKINSELIRNKYEQLSLVYLSNIENILKSRLKIYTIKN